jgi:CheY-like chemotaxis protein
VHLRLGRVNSHLEIAVEDTGPGLDPALLPYIFQPFRQGDASSTRLHGGLGLGLAIAQRLTELHGGTIEAANRRDGNGACFTVRLPIMSVAPIRAVSGVSDRRNPRAEKDVPLAAAPSLHGLKILVVDDDPDAREVLASVLSSRGADVVTAASGEEALPLVQGHHPDVLVCDIEMPGEDGYGVLRRIRQLPLRDGGRTPAAALTAYASTEDRMRALTAGFQMHLPKPVQPAELVTVVASLAANRPPVVTPSSKEG